MKKLFLLFIISMSINFSLNGQIIDSITYTPQYPQSGDIISIYCYVRYPSFGCHLQEQNIIKEGVNIIGQAFHCGGGLAALCPTIDTFQIQIDTQYIGYLNFYYMPGFITQSPCIFPILANGDTIPFPSTIDTINIPFNILSSVNSMENANNYRVYPLPTNNQLIIETKNSWNKNVSMELFNMNGQSLPLNYSQLDNRRLVVNTLNYPNGFYFCKIRNGNDIFTQKIIIQH